MISIAIVGMTAGALFMFARPRRFSPEAVLRRIIHALGVAASTVGVAVSIGWGMTVTTLAGAALYAALPFAIGAREARFD